MVETHRVRSGATLIELMVGLGVFTVIMGALFVALRAAQDTIGSGENLSANAEEGARVADRLKADLEETGIAFVDTSFRYHVSGGSDSMTNHAWDYSQELRQCSSASCPFNTRLAAGVSTGLVPQIHLGRNYGFYGAAQPGVVSSSGRVWWRPERGLCPYDNSYLYFGGEVDALSLFSPRRPEGAFITAEATQLEVADGLERKPDWQAIVLYIPVLDTQTQTYQLRRYVVYRQDMVHGNVPDTAYDFFNDAQSGGWGTTPTAQRWASNQVLTIGADGLPVKDAQDQFVLTSGEPTLIDLMDFSTDGSIDGVPDGKIPLTPATSDASSDSLTMYSYHYTDPNSGAESRFAYYYRYKYLNLGGDWKYFYLWIDPVAGTISTYLYFSENNEYWYRYTQLRRAPEIVARKLLDVDFSTFVSNPQSAQNPYGVANPNIVRVTLLLSKDTMVGGDARAIEHVVDFEVKPRN